jgi:hypothetical protein
MFFVRQHCAKRVRASGMLPTPRVPDNLPTPTNGIVIFVMLCLFVFGLMAFAKFMQHGNGSGLIEGFQDSLGNGTRDR